MSDGYVNPGIFSPGGSGFGSTRSGGGSGFMDSRAGGALVSGGLGLLGSILGGYGQGKMNEAQLKQAKELALRQEALQREQFAQQQARTGLEATQADPLAQQKSRQQQALFAAILPGLRNASVSSPIPGMQGFVPQISGGLRLPEGGFDPSTLAFFSPESRANAEGQYWRSAAPFVAPPDLSQVGYGKAGVGVNAPAQQLHDSAQQESRQRNAALLAALQQQIAASAAPSKKKGGKGGKVASGAATGAALGSVIPGIGSVIGGGIGALTGLFR